MAPDDICTGRVSAPPMPEASSVSILVVDDNTAKRLALRSVLIPLGHTIIEADSGLAAMRCVMAQDFAVILLDVRMPVMDGFETARRIREREQCETTPIIFITSFGPDDIRAEDFYAEGAVDFLFAPVPPAELRSKVSAFVGLFLKSQHLAMEASEANRSADDLQAQNLALAAVARQDPLTGLGNRRALQEDLAVLQARVARYGHRYCVALLDIDDFKSFNDAHGHQAGDRAIQQVATQLNVELRGGDAVYRYGGDEFLVVFPEQTLETGRLALERMRGKVTDLAVPHAGNALGILTVSAGLAMLDVDGDLSPVQVIKEADDALYRAKSNGRNQVHHQIEHNCADTHAVADAMS